MRALRMIGWLVAVPALWAADPPPAEKSSPPPEDALAAAKRKFAAVKAAREPGAKLDLPAASSLPELHVSDSGPPASMPAVKPASPNGKKAGNWLVDAMADQTKPAADAEPTADKGTLVSSSGPRPASPASDSRKLGGETAAAKKPIDPTLNPLNRYMAGWMMPGDFELLRAGVGAGAAGSYLDSGGGLSLAGLAGTAGGDGAADPAFGPVDGARLPAMDRSATPRENPYLQNLTAPAPPPGGALALSSPSSPSVPAASSFNAPLVPPPAPEPPKPVIPDFVKPRDDDKYFKPLKRF
jgi:hypothetical protein